MTLRVNMINSTSSNTRKASIVARPFPRVARGAWPGDETKVRPKKFRPERVEPGDEATFNRGHSI